MRRMRPSPDGRAAGCITRPAILHGAGPSNRTRSHRRTNSTRPIARPHSRTLTGTWPLTGPHPRTLTGTWALTGPHPRTLTGTWPIARTLTGTWALTGPHTWTLAGSGTRRQRARPIATYARRCRSARACTDAGPRTAGQTEEALQLRGRSSPLARPGAAARGRPARRAGTRYRRPARRARTRYRRPARRARTRYRRPAHRWAAAHRGPSPTTTRHAAATTTATAATTPGPGVICDQGGDRNHRDDPKTGPFRLHLLVSPMECVNWLRFSGPR